MNFHEPTLLALLAVASLISGAIFAALARISPATPGPGYWAVGSFGIGLAMLANVFVDAWPLASLMFNIPLTFGLVFQFVGTLRFCGRDRVRGLLYAWLAYNALVVLLFTLVVPAAKFRIPLLAGGIALVNAWSAVVLWRQAPRFGSALFRVAASARALEACATVAQGMLVLTAASTVSYGAPEVPWSSLIAWSALMLNTLVCDPMLLILVALRLVGELREASERNAVAARRAEEASEAKTVFLANMSHELRTPLNAVLGFARLMRRSPSLGPAERDNLSIIRKSGEHLLELINQVLSIAKIEAGSMTLDARPFDPREMLSVLERMFQARCEESGLEFRLDLDPSLPRAVRGDAAKLRQVLINLLGNGVKFTRAGHVGLRVRWDPPYARFEVHDTGPGISAEELPKLFQPFVQAEAGRGAKEGTGLGLAISQRIVTLMGGAIVAESTPGRGTTFRFDAVLEPCAPVAEPRGPGPVLGLAMGQRAPRVAVVDDAPVNRALLERLLAAVGIPVRTAEDGEQALALWREWRPELIFMDLRMPVLDGREATRRIRAEERARNLPSVPIVAITASVFENEGEALVAQGFDEVIHKPYGEEQIFAALERRLGTRFAHEATPAPAGAPAPEPVQPTPDRPGERVLLVDDDPISRAVARELLRDSFDPVEASGGHEAIELLAADPGIALVLLDVEMPGMGGIETVRRIRAGARYAALPVVAMTAHGDPDDVARLAAAGMDGHVTKPIDPRQLEAAIAHARAMRATASVPGA